MRQSLSRCLALLLHLLYVLLQAPVFLLRLVVVQIFWVLGLPQSAEQADLVALQMVLSCAVCARTTQRALVSSHLFLHAWQDLYFCSYGRVRLEALNIGYSPSTTFRSIG